MFELIYPFTPSLIFLMPALEKRARQILLARKFREEEIMVSVLYKVNIFTVQKL